LPSFGDIQKVHEKWNIFRFYSKFKIANGFEIIAFENGDLKKFVYYSENPDSG
jgi:hypothetical protein